MYKRDIVLMHNEMKLLTLTCKVDQKRYDSVILDLEEFEEYELQELFEWLRGIYENQYKQLKYVWTLLTPEMWEKYKTFNIEGTREQGMLKDAKKAMRLVWETPYRTALQLDRIARKKGVNRHKM